MSFGAFDKIDFGLPRGDEVVTFPGGVTVINVFSMFLRSINCADVCMSGAWTNLSNGFLKITLFISWDTPKAVVGRFAWMSI